MKKKLIIILLIILINITIYATKYETVEVTGMGYIINENVEIAREKAIEDALRLSVEKVVGTIISSTETIEDGVLIEDKIYKNSAGFVKRYEIIREDYNPEYETYYITIRAQVMTAEIELELKDILMSAGTAKLVTYIEDPSNLSNKLKTDLINSGIELIDTNQLEDIKDRDQILNIKNDEFTETGLWFWSRYILRGKIEIKDEGIKYIGNTRVNVLSLNYTYELIDTINARVIQVFTDNLINNGATYTAARTRLENAAYENLEGKIGRALADYYTRAEIVTLFSSGIENTRQILSSIPGISQLERIDSINQQEQFIFRYNGNIDTLGRRLSENNIEVNIQGTIIRINQRKIQIEIKNTTFADFAKINQAYPNEQINFSNGRITMTIAGNPTNIAFKLHELGYEIITIEGNYIKAEKQ